MFWKKPSLVDSDPVHCSNVDDSVLAWKRPRLSWEPFSETRPKILPETQHFNRWTHLINLRFQDPGMPPELFVGAYQASDARRDVNGKNTLPWLNPTLKLQDFRFSTPSWGKGPASEGRVPAQCCAGRSWGSARAGQRINRIKWTEALAASKFRHNKFIPSWVSLDYPQHFPKVYIAI